MTAVRIRTPKEEFTVDYPKAIEYADKQSNVFWPHNEVKVHKDKQDILVNMTEAERHGVITVLKLFTKYEQIIGDEFWLNFVFKKFPRPADIQPMAAIFGGVELQVHGKFYSTLNEELGLADDKFYNEYKDDPVLSERISFLYNTLDQSDDLKALGAFTFGEGAILYTSFAFLKHFQSQGKNKLLNVVSGINFSARDENLHSEAAGWLFQTLLKEEDEAGLLTEEYKDSLKQSIYDAADIVLDHEKQIVRKLLEKGDIEGVDYNEFVEFAKSRINLCLRNMGYENKYIIDDNPVSEWFYKGINGYMMGDFFSSQNNQYERAWSEAAFHF